MQGEEGCIILKINNTSRPCISHDFGIKRYAMSTVTSPKTATILYAQLCTFPLVVKVEM